MGFTVLFGLKLFPQPCLLFKGSQGLFFDNRSPHEFHPLTLTFFKVFESLGPYRKDKLDPKSNRVYISRKVL